MPMTVKRIRAVQPDEVESVTLRQYASIVLLVELTLYPSSNMVS